MQAAKCFLFLVLATALFLGGTEAFAQIGTVLDVKPGATLTSGGRTKPLRAGMQVDSGDAIKTNGSGVVQIVFMDQTKIAVGPNASMTVTASMMRGQQKAKNLAVKTLGGSFRFISGNSEKSAYKIETPTATMGIRGTIFDFWVLDTQQTSLAILDGSVRMCGDSGSCKYVTGSCVIAVTTPRGGVAHPKDSVQAEKAITNGFPFILSQEHLREPLRTNVGGCGKYLTPPTRSVVTPIFAPQPPAPPAPAPAPAPAPDVDDPPAPPSTNFPGQSGPYGNSRGQGNEISQGQHGYGTGNGQGYFRRAFPGTPGPGASAGTFGADSAAESSAESGSSETGGTDADSGGNGNGNGNGKGNGNGNWNGRGNGNRS